MDWILALALCMYLGFSRGVITKKIYVALQGGREIRGRRKDNSLFQFIKQKSVNPHKYLEFAQNRETFKTENIKEFHPINREQWFHFHQESEPCSLDTNCLCLRSTCSHILSTLVQYHETQTLFYNWFLCKVTAIGINIKWWKYHLVNERNWGYLVLKFWKIAENVEALIKFTKCWNSYHAKVSFDKENHRNESAAALKVVLFANI